MHYLKSILFMIVIGSKFSELLSLASEEQLPDINVMKNQAIGSDI